MKNIVFVFLATFLFSAFSTYAQDNVTVIDVDGVKINIPKPNKKYTEVNIFELGASEDIASPLENLYCTFIDSSDFKNYLNSNFDSIEMNSLILVGDLNEEELSIDGENYFEDIKKEDIGTLPKDLNQILDSANYFFNNTNSYNFIDNDENAKQIGCILDITDAYGIAMCTFSEDHYGIKKQLITLAFIKVKGKILTAIIYNPFNGYESIKSLADFTDKWVNQILDIN